MREVTALASRNMEPKEIKFDKMSFYSFGRAKNVSVVLPDADDLRVALHVAFLTTTSKDVSSTCFNLVEAFISDFMDRIK